MKKRIFVAINLPDSIKKELIFYKKNFQEIPANWVNQENLHITLKFIGLISQNNLEIIKDSLKKISCDLESFTLEIVKINYVKPQYSMIWAYLNNSSNLKNLVDKVSQEISKIKIENIKTIQDQFVPHITLARIKKWQFKKNNIEDIPQIENHLSLKFKVQSMEIMESIIKKDGPQYKIIDKILFKK